MCGITGIINDSRAFGKAIMSLEAMRHRGKDGCGISDGKTVHYAKSLGELKELNLAGDSFIAHNLHSVVGFVKQPLTGKGILAINGEIYNWKELCKKHGIEAGNDAELLLKLIEKKKTNSLKNINLLLKELQGEYAFAYCTQQQGKKLFLARDLIGVKPLWIARNEESFAFASERKALLAMGFELSQTRELHPRHILELDSKTGTAKDFYKGFFRIPKEGKSKAKIDFEKAKEKVSELIEDSVRQMIPESRVGILFSGGVDSTLLAVIAKKLEAKVTCYTAAASENAKDLIWAKRTAEKLDLELKYAVIGQSEIESYLKKIVPTIEDSSVVKAAVSLPIYVACELAAKDGIKVMLSGSGSDEIFCGYERHCHGLSLVKESYYELLRFFERNSYRDDVLAMNNNLELRLPYLDNRLVEYALSLPDDFKIKSGTNKRILREAALAKGVPLEVAVRKKTAAQYGSGFDGELEKLAKRKGVKKLLPGFTQDTCPTFGGTVHILSNTMKKADYLAGFLGHKNLRLCSLVSTGKDSLFAMHLMEEQNYETACLLTMKSEDKDSYMFHTPAIEIAKLQAEAMGKPLIEVATKGKKEEELVDLKKGILKAVSEFGIEGITSGAIHSNYQRERLEAICDEIGIKCFSPMWHSDEESLLRAMLREGFEIMIVKTAAMGLEGLCGKIIDKGVIVELKKLKEKYCISMAGEGGEFETLVLDAPMFKKRIVIDDCEISEKGSVAEARIKKSHLEGKMSMKQQDENCERKEAMERILKEVRNAKSYGKWKFNREEIYERACRKL